ANLREGRRPIPRVQMLFLPIEHQLHRRFGLTGELRTEDALYVGRELAAEAAAHVLRDHAYVRLRNPERLRKTLRALMHALRRHPRRELVAVPLADGSVRFETHVGDHMRGACGFEDVRRV